MTRTVAAPAGPVIDAVLGAAAGLGLQTGSVDRRAGELKLLRPTGRAGRSHRIFVTVTDNGRGGSTVHASWEDSFPGRVSDRRAAARLCDETRRLLLA